MSVNPCNVCGGTDLNLVDGFYYCVECGTQDVNVQETVVEHTTLGDGTFAHFATKKIATVLKDGIEMSGEWYKWHAYNFILSGLTDELIAAGARPSVKMKVMWVWTRYIKKFQIKEDSGVTSELENIQERYSQGKKQYNSDKEDSNKEKRKLKSDTFGKDINIVRKGVLCAILYVALNLDGSDIQISHLLRYVKEGRLSIANCTKFVPEELDTKSIPHWQSFLKCVQELSLKTIRAFAMTLFKSLDLGTPLVPDVRKIIDNYVTELCLPKDFKNLVLSLMHLVPCDFKIYCKWKRGLVRIPNFEGVAMSYILVALKMCFGLDDEHEVKISDAIDKINNEENNLKSYKLGLESEPSERLFSFREWCNYLQFRKISLCKYYLPMAQQHSLETDDHVFMEHLGERHKRKIEVSDEVTMNILNKISEKNEAGIIPKAEFPPTLTPLSTYTDVINLNKYFQEPELRLLLSEDFTQYSLKYACKDLNLSIQLETIFKGVSESNKTINPKIIGTLVTKKGDFKMVYVRNCENKNWLMTNPPTIDHVVRIDEEYNDKDSDRGYDSHTENNPVGNEPQHDPIDSRDDDDLEPEKKLEIIDEENEDINIFDDLFDDVDVDDKKKNEQMKSNAPKNVVNSFDFDTDPNDHFQDKNVLLDSKSDALSQNSDVTFNPVNFDREDTIKELILAACKKYKIPKPAEFNPSGPRKRKSSLVYDGAGVRPVKRSRPNYRPPGEDKQEISRILSAYYDSLENDLSKRVSIVSVVGNLENSRNLDESTNEVEGDLSNITLSYNAMETTVGDDNDVEINLGSSLIEVTNEDEYIGDLMPKGDPKFDPKTHDIKQLYVKFKKEVNYENIIQFNDPTLDALLDRKIEECRINEPIELCASDFKEPQTSSSDSEDDLPLTVLLQERILLREKARQRKENLEPLVQSDIKEFKYWFRHYTKAMVRNADMSDKFDIELKENCPKSFNFVIHECAAVLDCTAYSLYKCMQNLEQVIISKIE